MALQILRQVPGAAKCFAGMQLANREQRRLPLSGKHARVMQPHKAAAQDAAKDSRKIQPH
jgi:hypothetical protein